MNISRRNFFFEGAGMAACGGLSALGGDSRKIESVVSEAKKIFKLYPVGRVQKKGETAAILIFDKYTDALQGLDDFSHVFVLYWFDKNDTVHKRSILQVHPRGNKKNPLTGVFACRAPVRPNLIALSLCKIVSVKGGTVYIDKIDAFDGSPVLDLKPYIPGIDSPKKAVEMPDWLGRGG